MVTEGAAALPVFSFAVPRLDKLLGHRTSNYRSRHKAAIRVTALSIDPMTGHGRPLPHA
jgi:hypothetical protein